MKGFSWVLSKQTLQRCLSLTCYKFRFPVLPIPVASKYWYQSLLANRAFVICKPMSPSMGKTFFVITVLLADAIVYLYYTTKKKKKKKQTTFPSSARLFSDVLLQGFFCVTNAAFRQGKTDLSTMRRLTHLIAPCKGIQGSLGFCIIPQRGFGFQVLDSMVFVSGTWIPNSKRQLDSGFLELLCRFQRPGFRIPEAKISRIPEYVIPLHGANISYRPIRPRVQSAHCMKQYRWYLKRQ